MEKYQGPSQYKPVSAWGYFGYMILYSIPVIGFIFLLIHTFSKKNINRRNFARSFWCALLVIVALAAIAAIIGLITGALDNVGEALKEAIESIKGAVPGLNF